MGLEDLTATSGQVLVGVGSFTTGSRQLVTLGPTHPSRAGTLGFNLTLEQGTITGAEIEPGWMHRGAEKLFEARDWRQVIMLAARHDWLSSISGETGLAMAIEQALGIMVPHRAKLIRMALLEIGRAHAQLSLLTFVGYRLSDAKLSATIENSRQLIRQTILSIAKNRVHPMVTRLGGVSQDADDQFVNLAKNLIGDLTKTCTQIADALNQQQSKEIFGSVAELDCATIDEYGLSGPTARAVKQIPDLRFNPGYLAYSELGITNENHQAGNSALARFESLVLDIELSLQILAGTLAQLAQTSGPINIKLAKIIKVPDSKTHFRIEAPGGIAGFTVWSRAETTPWRISLRTPTFAQMCALEKLLIGVKITDFDIAVASMGYAIGDLDK